MPEWLLSILIGGVIMSLMGIIYKQMLTKSEHADLCKKNTGELATQISQVLKEEIKDVKEYFDLKIENVVLKEIKKINGGHH